MDLVDLPTADLTDSLGQVEKEALQVIMVLMEQLCPGATLKEQDMAEMLALPKGG